MKIYADKLQQHNPAQFSAYVVAGEEPLLKQEAQDFIRHALQQQGLMDERLRFSLDADFHWEDVFNAFNELSLFSQTRLIELHFDKQPDKRQQNQLSELCAQLNPDSRLMLCLPKLSKTSDRQAWYKQLEPQALVVMIYPPEGQQLLAWIRQRLQHHGVAAQAELPQLLQHYYEGNLLALDQAVQSIALRWGGKQASLSDIEQGLAQASRFSSFQLTDALLSGDIKRSLHILKQLRLEGDDPTLLNWSLDKELKLLQKLQLSPAQQHAAIFKQNGVWAKRQTLVRQASLLFSPEKIHQARLHVGDVDLAIKSFDTNNAWHLLEVLLVQLAKPSHVPT